MVTKTINLTQKTIEALPLPEKGKRAYHRDEQEKDLLLCITSSGVMSFQVYRKLNGKPVRVTLGRYPAMKIPLARKMARQVSGQLAEGINPNQAKKALRARGRTLKQVYKDYLKARKALKHRSTYLQLHMD